MVLKLILKKNKDWTLLSSQKKVNEAILERVVFNRKYSNNIEVYLVADAYQGGQIDACLNDFMSAVSGKQKNYILVKD